MPPKTPQTSRETSNIFNATPYQDNRVKVVQENDPEKM